MEARLLRRRRAVPGASCTRSYEPPLSQCDVSQHQRMRRRHRDLADAEDMAQLLGRYLQRPRPWPLASLGCGEGGRHRCLVGHLALDLLHDLVDVAVEHGHRAKALQIRQCLRCVLGHIGTWVSTTIGVEALNPFKSFSSHSSWSLPKPPACDFSKLNTLVIATKCTPAWSKL